MAFTRRVVEVAKKTESDYPRPVAITITGHSLGGTLAEITAAKFNLPAETFNAYGPAGLKNLKDYGVDVNGKYPNIVNHVRATDVVSAGSPHFGEVHTYAAPQDIESLRRGRYLESGSLHLPTNPLLTADLSAHKMSNFLPNNDVIGESILSPLNEARARAYRAPIALYRQDVVQGRIDLTMVAHRTPSPLHQFNPLDPGVKLQAQALDAGTIIAAQAVSIQVTQSVHEAQRTAQKVGHAVSNGAVRAYDTLFVNKPIAPAAPLDHPAHPDHALFKQAQDGVHKMDAKVGRSPDPRSDQLAACLVVAARSDGMSHIDHVTLSTDASKVFAVQGSLHSSFKQITNVLTVESLNTPIAQSSQALDRVIHQKALEPLQHNHQPMQQPAHADHALFMQAQSGVHQLDAKAGRTPDQRSDNLAAALVVAARNDGMSRIDHVSLSTDAARVFAVQGALSSPFKQIASVLTVESLNTPVAQSTLAWDRAIEQVASQSREQQAPEPTRQTPHPALAI